MPSNVFIMTPAQNPSAKRILFKNLQEGQNAPLCLSFTCCLSAFPANYPVIGGAILHFIPSIQQFRQAAIARQAESAHICAESKLHLTSQHLSMKKIAILLCVIATMGFTVAREDNAAGVAAKPASQKIDRTYGYIETTSSQSYTITLQ